MATEIERITRMLEKTFDKHPWYGPSVMDVLSEVTQAEASRRAGQSHSIIELVLHMTSWRTFAIRRLQGDHAFQVSDQVNFPEPTSWDEALNKLKQSQAELVAAARDFSESRLSDLVPSNSHKYTYYTLLHGIIQHDVYHIGQVQLIRKSAVVK
jgi:uncharacterized damage-inducible protein DinB